tara:strand:+ start:1152 stop:2300 length:1149 start_codon:yes stop_codon:yes gene_type:complete
MRIALDGATRNRKAMIDETYIEDMKARLGGLEAQFSEPDLMANQKRYRELVRDHATVRRRLEKAEACLNVSQEIAEHQALIAAPETDAELAELAREELQGLEARLPVVEREFTVSLIPEDPDDARAAVMEIRAGTGGDEAGLFAGDLLRMYTRYAERHDMTIEIVDASASDVGGYKEILCTLRGENAYKHFKFESGVHRVQRVPATESQGRIHTSAATVAVFPEADEQDDIEIDPDELRIDLFCASGPGGQSVNTTYSAVRITHIPTGLVAQSQDERSQHRNKDKAMGVLRSRILDHRRREESERMGDARRSQIGSGDRSERTRTYNFPQNRLTEHRINLTLYSLDRIMEGELDEVIVTLGECDLEERLKTEMKDGLGGNVS